MGSGAPAQKRLHNKLVAPAYRDRRRGGGKGASLRRLCELLSVPAQCVAAFGNGDNDADMLSFAGLGVAMENATEACIAASDAVCASNDEHGVAQMIYKILGDMEKQ